jgi:RNA polymerase sigma-70 factor (ECF subfamily)
VEKEPHAVSSSEAEHDFSELDGKPSVNADDVRRREAFARLFATHDRWLYSYLVTLLGSTAHAEEVFQEVCVVLWREYETFELGTDFVKWVAVIAHNQVRKFRRQRKQVGFQLDEITFDLLAAEAVERVDLFDCRRDALRRCLTKLPVADRALVEECYQEHKVNFKATALRLGRPENTVYKALNRIRRVLFECINRALVSEGLL